MNIQVRRVSQQHTLKNETNTKRESFQRAIKGLEDKFSQGTNNAHKKFSLLKEQVRKVDHFSSQDCRVI